MAQIENIASTCGDSCGCTASSSAASAAVAAPPAHDAGDLLKVGHY
jgi:hypothetical protein